MGRRRNQSCHWDASYLVTAELVFALEPLRVIVIGLEYDSGSFFLRCWGGRVAGEARRVTSEQSGGYIHKFQQGQRGMPSSVPLSTL